MENLNNSLHFILAKDATMSFAYMCKDGGQGCGLDGKLVAYHQCNMCIHSVHHFGIKAINPDAKIYCKEE